MGDSHHSIHLVGVVLTHTVPMHRSTVVAHGVGDANNNGVAPVSLDERTRSLSVNAQSTALDADGGDFTFGDLEVDYNRIVASLGHDVV